MWAATAVTTTERSVILQSMEEWDDFRYIDASVSTGSLASSEKSLLTRSSESSSIVDGVQGGTSKKHKSSGLKLDGIELIRLQNG